MKTQHILLLVFIVTLVSIGDAKEPAKKSKNLELAATTRTLPLQFDPDLPLEYMQVAIETLVVEVNEEYTRDIGIKWAFNRNENRSPSQILEGTTVRLPVLLDPVTIPNFKDIGTGGGFVVTQVTRAPGIGATLAGMDIGDVGRVSASIRALMEEGKAELRTRTIAVSLNKKQAQIETVEEVPFQDIRFGKKGESYLDVKFEKVGIKLHVTPHIIEPISKQRVKLDLTNIEVSGVSRFITIRQVNRPVFEKSEAHTSIILNNAETLVIGGLKTKRRVVNESRVPILGRIPLLGWLFKNQRVEEKNRDLLFFVTPYILTPGVNPILPFDFESGEVLNKSTSEK